VCCRCWRNLFLCGRPVLTGLVRRLLLSLHPPALQRQSCLQVVNLGLQLLLGRPERSNSVSRSLSGLFGALLWLTQGSFGIPELCDLKILIAHGTVRLLLFEQPLLLPALRFRQLALQARHLFLQRLHLPQGPNISAKRALYYV